MLKVFVSEDGLLKGSPLEAAGLIPLSDAERTEVLNNIRNKKAL
ncbi:hypothetical protein [Alishewanella longhuensis]